MHGRVASLLELGAGFHLDFSGRANIYMNGIMMGYTRREMAAKIDEIIDFAELGPYIDEPVRTYSSGMGLRLGFSVAVAVDPDILIIDDTQFLQGKSIQQEFCHLLNALIDSAKQVICAADRPAMELESLDPRVRSRLSNGITLELAAPDYEMRRSIIRTRAAAMRAEDASFDMPDGVIDTIAQRVAGSGRDLEGAFNQIAFRHSLGQPLSAEHLDDLLSQLTRANSERRVRIEDILKFVSRHYNVTRTDILSARRTRTIVRPRQIAMYLAKTMTPRSLPEIGRRFGGRDHTTVLHAVRKIEGERAKDDKLSEELDIIRRMIEE